MSKSKSGKFIELDYYLSFTSKKFYYAEDIKYTLKKLGLPYNGKKAETKERLDKFYKSLRRYKANINVIIKLQKMYRNKVKSRQLEMRGPGFLDKSLCVNDEDFLTFEGKDEIDPYYFFSFRDSTGVVFFFDVRSILKLIELKQNNPYTTEAFSESVKTKVLNIVKKLKHDGVYKDHEEGSLTEEQKYKARVIKLFQTIDELDIVAGGSDPRWYFDLNFKRMKDFYRVLEDIWNYRAELTNQRKAELVPTRKIFNMNPKYILGVPENKNKFKILIDFLLNEMEEMVTASENIENRKTCALFILTAFTEIHPRAAEALPWLVQH